MPPSNVLRSVAYLAGSNRARAKEVTDFITLVSLKFDQPEGLEDRLLLSLFLPHLPSLQHLSLSPPSLGKIMSGEMSLQSLSLLFKNPNPKVSIRDNGPFETMIFNF